jgi:hypothetical protein
VLYLGLGEPLRAQKNKQHSLRVLLIFLWLASGYPLHHAFASLGMVPLLSLSLCACFAGTGSKYRASRAGIKYLIRAYLLLEAAKPPILAGFARESERDSSGTTEARSHEMASAKVMERIARRERIKIAAAVKRRGYFYAAKRLAQQFNEE